MPHDLDSCAIFPKCRTWTRGVVWNLSSANILGSYMRCLSATGLKEHEDAPVELNGLQKTGWGLESSRPFSRMYWRFGMNCKVSNLLTHLFDPAMRITPTSAINLPHLLSHKFAWSSICSAGDGFSTICVSSWNLGSCSKCYSKKLPKVARN